MTPCTKQHRHDEAFASLPTTQAAASRHKCAGCAYDKGYKQGYSLADVLTLDLESLPESQAGSVRHKSAHAAFALGYLNATKDRLSGKPPTAGGADD